LAKERCVLYLGRGKVRIDKSKVTPGRLTEASRKKGKRNLGRNKGPPLKEKLGGVTVSIGVCVK